MLKQGLQQKLQQKMSPLQIQTIKLLELPLLELEQKIQKEIEENPVLDEETELPPADAEDDGPLPKRVSLNDIPEDSTPSYKLYVNNQGKDLKPEYNTFSVKESFQQSLINQLGYKHLSERERQIAQFIIGSLDDDGYLRRPLESVMDDISFKIGVDATEEEMESMLRVVQSFDPVGVGARNLQECLILQMEARNKSPHQQMALEVLKNYFDEFTKKHFQRIITKLGISQSEMKAIMEEIVKLNPRPGGQVDDSYVEQVQQIVPDFNLENKDGELILSQPKFSLPELRVNKRYSELLSKTSASKSRSEREASSFVKQKLDSAKWFIEAIKQRHNTLQSTMQAILEFQKEFFTDGEETKLKPMVLKDIAEMTKLDISTISRVVNCKYIQTPFGIYPLKYFFSEGLMTESGEEVSTREIKLILQESVDAEDKSKPLTDEELVEVLHAKGYNVARRTVAKYRDQLNIPIARLRKEL